ncbi:DNA polymerase-3 subunit epsilon [Alkalithermobacter thermoalcaliphilus JW-YL-7 = DSM 7308]|uniref:DNA polymerase III, epsilon subunit n=1 Tax=Alkalithermobacter thermoalcaliphilus JW-YL-7 = DSM 7308 TaxID=1121328 RepID=A0A150FR25_CLOPD|nr:DNA polymerase III, epsilon subunit [[Clostridium] paradoxum JW-YL-7 = DSM 7308]SHL12340.1 DNA polymerase-3 subunit epsilon [[Clostridium] paradoxum JW-YL-7 = DSM 7308]
MLNFFRILTGIFFTLFTFLMLGIFIMPIIENPFIGILIVGILLYVSYKIGFKLANKLFKYQKEINNTIDTVYEKNEIQKDTEIYTETEDFTTEPAIQEGYIISKEINSPVYSDKVYKNFVVLDFETTGLDPNTDKIIEIAALKYIDRSLVDEFVTLVNPEITIPKKITKINGITDDMVNDKPTIKEVLPSLLQFIGDLPIVAHNAPFDARFLKYAVLNNFGEDSIENNFIDTVKIAREIYPNLTNHKLTTIKEHLNINLSSHRAYNDTLVTAQIYLDYSKKKINEYNSQIPIFDQIDEDIYMCFITHKSGMNEKFGTSEDFCKLEEKISEICKKNNGRHYKAASKNVKFAIIFNYLNRTKSCVDTLRNKGYKVTTFEEAIKFFELDYMWDIESLVNAEKEYKEFSYKIVE